MKLFRSQRDDGSILNSHTLQRLLVFGLGDIYFRRTDTETSADPSAIISQVPTPDLTLLCAKPSLLCVMKSLCRYERSRRQQ